MARRPRQDLLGSWHDVINRGLANRPLFENREDIQLVLSRLAREVRRERISLAIASALSSSQRRLRVHHSLAEEDSAHARRAGEIGAAALAAFHPAFETADASG